MGLFVSCCTKDHAAPDTNTAKLLPEQKQEQKDEENWEQYDALNLSEHEEEDAEEAKSQTSKDFLGKAVLKSQGSVVDALMLGPDELAQQASDADNEAPDEAADRDDNEEKEAPAVQTRTDEFVKCGRNLQINESKDIVTCIEEQEADEAGSAFGAIGVDMKSAGDKIYRWNMKVLQYEANKCGLRFGISSNMECIEKPFNTKGPISYALDEDGKIQSADEQASEYGLKTFRAGDVLGVELNVKQRSVSFYKNEQTKGVAYTEIDADGVYCFAVSFAGKDNSVQLVEFVETDA